MAKSEFSENVPTWMPCAGNGAEPINSFALVAYIPDPLGAFLDNLRRELVPTCIPHAHVTVLSPRPLLVHPKVAWQQAYEKVCDHSGFEVEATEVDMFELTSVIYLSIGKGRRELSLIHDLLNDGDLRFSEPYPYHPHITLAQNLLPEDVPGVFEQARQKWAEWRKPRSFVADTLTFVQNTTADRWLDLAQCSLNTVPSLRGDRRP